MSFVGSAWFDMVSVVKWQSREGGLGNLVRKRAVGWRWKGNAICCGGLGSNEIVAVS